MPVDASQLVELRKYRTRAVRDLFANYYPSVHRMAIALTGEADTGLFATRAVFKNVGNALPRFRDEEAPDRWFHHHTVITARRLADLTEWVPAREPLIDPALIDDASYLAFLVALRKLPAQQREAFILHYGEQLTVRYLSVAMDCSIIAAENHFDAADKAMKRLAGNRFDEFVASLTKQYRALTPTERLVVPNVRRALSRLFWPRRIAMVLQFLFVAAILVTLGWFLKRIFPYLEW